MLNRKWYQASKPEMEFNIINIIYAALPRHAQTEKTTFSSKDNCILTKHTRRWINFPLRLQYDLCLTSFLPQHYIITTILQIITTIPRIITTTSLSTSLHITKTTQQYGSSRLHYASSPHHYTLSPRHYTSSTHYYTSSLHHYTYSLQHYSSSLQQQQ